MYNLNLQHSSIIFNNMGVLNNISWFFYMTDIQLRMSLDCQLSDRLRLVYPKIDTPDVTVN